MLYAKFLPSQYVLRYRKGKIVSEGVGLSFFFLEKNTSACAIPVSNTDSDFIFEETTKDFQTVSVQGQLTYHIVDFKKISSAMDFTVNLKTKKYNDTPLVKLSKRIINISEVIIKSYIAELTLTDAIQSSQVIAEKVLEKLKNVAEIKALGVEINGFSVLKISANSETVRALEAKTREEILKQSDDALYEIGRAHV